MFGSSASRVPSLERFVIPGLPVRVIWRHCHVCLNVKAEIGAIIEHDAYGDSGISSVDFHTIDDLAFELSERGMPCAPSAGTRSLTVSQLRLLVWCERLGARSGSYPERVPTPLVMRSRRDCNEKRAKNVGLGELVMPPSFSSSN